MSNLIAQDKRVIDQDGRLRVAGCKISKANVCRYYGREIPGAADRGLDPDTLYQVYRDPDELRKAAKSFETVPVLMEHVPITAEYPATDLVVGTASNVRYEHPYLVADLTIWRQDAIGLIESGAQKEISCGYRYEPVFGNLITKDGLQADVRMVNLVANHIALVKEGRAGPDVVVADRVPPNMRFSKFLSALATAFGVTAQPEQLAAMDAALVAELKETEPDGGIVEVPVDTAKIAQDAAVAAAVAEAVKDKVVKADADKLAQDAATAARAEVHALYDARKAVEQTAGVVALDSAEAVYRFALDALKVEHKEIPATALAALYEQAAKAPAPIAQDAAPALSLTELFPGLTFIRRG